VGALHLRTTIADLHVLGDAPAVGILTTPTVVMITMTPHLVTDTARAMVVTMIDIILQDAIGVTTRSAIGMTTAISATTIIPHDGLEARVSVANVVMP
jgi:hypothetical protein